jgi:hypothetical protein
METVGVKDTLYHHNVGYPDVNTELEVCTFCHKSFLHPFHRYYDCSIYNYTKISSDIKRSDNDIIEITLPIHVPFITGNLSLKHFPVNFNLLNINNNYKYKLAFHYYYDFIKNALPIGFQLDNNVEYIYTLYPARKDIYRIAPVYLIEKFTQDSLYKLQLIKKRRYFKAIYQIAQNDRSNPRCILQIRK